MADLTARAVVVKSKHRPIVRQRLRLAADTLKSPTCEMNVTGSGCPVGPAYINLEGWFKFNFIIEALIRHRPTQILPIGKPSHTGPTGRRRENATGMLPTWRT